MNYDELNISPLPYKDGLCANEGQRAAPAPE
jgi:hypothetical protein